MKPRKHLQSRFHQLTKPAPEQYFQRGAGLTPLFRWIARRFERPKSPAQLLNEHLSDLRGSFQGELSSALAAALLAKKALDTTRQVPMPFPEEYLAGVRAVDEEGREMLISYVNNLLKLKQDMLRFNSLFSLAVAKGLNTWITTLYALSRPDLMPKGREAWSLLMRGEKGVEEAYRMLLRRRLSDAEKIYLTYRPAVFISAGTEIRVS